MWTFSDGSHGVYPGYSMKQKERPVVCDKIWTGDAGWFARPHSRESGHAVGTAWFLGLAWFTQLFYTSRCARISAVHVLTTCVMRALQRAGPPAETSGAPHACVSASHRSRGRASPRAQWPGFRPEPVGGTYYCTTRYALFTVRDCI